VKAALKGGGARWALGFLALLAALSLLAPLLPLPSPIALSLRGEPGPPVAPWEELGGEGFRAEYWPLGPLDRRLVELRRSLFGAWQSGPWLGTDSKGRDLLSRLVWGSRTSLAVGLAAAFCSLVIGVLYGALSGLAGGRVDEAMMRLVDLLYSLPFVFLVIFALALLEAPRGGWPGISREQVLYLVIGAVGWLTMARVVRGQVLTLRESEFVKAARVLGSSTPRILATHVVPNVLPVAAAYLTLTVPSVILLEAFLSFLGLGVEPPRVSWGLLAADGVSALNRIQVSWWLIVFPSAAIAATLLALNVLGDALRDALDVRGQGGR